MLSEIINCIVNEQEYTTMRVISEDEERSYLESLSEREAVFIAEAGGKIIGMQSIDSPYKWSDKMEHVGKMGTLELKDYRRQGLGKKMAEKTLSFAKLCTYEKIVTFVLADNVSVLRFYKSLGFKRVGTWKKQAKLWGEYKDDILMEIFL
jgi:RimJ/RimL family protein N-acetyltransferase